jgi:hypothetical protein
MSHGSGVRRRLAPWTLCGVAVAIAAGAAWAGAAAKVPNAEDIKKLVAKLYNGEIPFDSSSGREKAFVDIEKIMSKDKTGLALKTPDFWVDAIHVGRFAGSGAKRHMGELKKTKSLDFDVTTKDGKQTKAKLWYHAGALLSASKPCPVLVTILEKGTDPKAVAAYIDATWEANKDILEQWVVGAIALSDEFPVAKDSVIVGVPFIQLRELFNTDANRWYLEGVGNACNETQTAASQIMANRLAGLVLRGATKAVTSANTALYPTLVVHSKQVGDKPGPEQTVFEAYKKINETLNEELVVDDVPSVTAANDQVVAWFAKHPLREMPTKYTWVTTFTDTEEGESWAGTIHIQTPAKRGQPTKLSVSYLRDTNTVDIQADNLGECTVFMNDQLLNLDKPVTVIVNGAPSATNNNKLMERDLRKMFDIADNYSEWGRAFTAECRVVVPTKIAAPPPPDAGQPPTKPGDNPPANPPADKPPANPPTDKPK